MARPIVPARVALGGGLNRKGRIMGIAAACRGGWDFVGGPVFLAILTIASSGCAHTAREITAEATPTGLESALTTLAKPENQHTLEAVLEQLPVEDFSSRVARGGTEGTLAAAPALAIDPQQVDAWARPYVAMLSQMLGEAADEQLVPRVRAVVRAIVDELAALAAEDRPRAAMNESGAVVGHAIGSGLGEGLAQGMREHLGPAIGAAVSEEVAPAISTVIQEQFEAAAVHLEAMALDQVTAETSRAAMRGAALGLDDALQKLEAQHERTGEGSLVVRLPEAASSGISMAQVLAWVVAGVGLVMALWLVWLMYRIRRTLEDVRVDVRQSREERGG